MSSYPERFRSLMAQRGYNLFFIGEELAVSHKYLSSPVRLCDLGEGFSSDEIFEFIETEVKERGGSMPYHLIIRIIDTDGNENYVIKKGDELHALDPNVNMGKAFRPKNLEQEMAMSYLNDESIQVVTLGGVAGAGKSFLALTEGMHEVKAGKVDKVILFRSMY